MKRKLLPTIDEKLALKYYNAGMVDWEIAVRCDCETSSIQRWRTRRGLPPNGKGHLPGFLSPKDKYERTPPEPMKVKKEAGMLVKVYPPMFADGYWAQPNVRPKRDM
jgi:hypothetical protein